jgi:DNA polymerase-3 subunit chi
LDAAMTDILFYHLERQPLERVLPKLLERTLERGWRAVIETDSDDRVEALSAMLWTYTEEGFLPHGTARDGNGEDQPVWITAADDNPNRATVRFFVGGAEPSAYEGIERIVLLIDGADNEAIERARRIWKQAKGVGHTVSYWQQDERGRWQNKAQGSATDQEA